MALLSWFFIGLFIFVCIAEYWFHGFYMTWGESRSKIGGAQESRSKYDLLIPLILSAFVYIFLIKNFMSKVKFQD